MSREPISAVAAARDWHRTFWRAYAPSCSCRHRRSHRTRRPCRRLPSTRRSTRSPPVRVSPPTRQLVDAWPPLWIAPRARQQERTRSRSPSGRVLAADDPAGRLERIRFSRVTVDQRRIDATARNVSAGARFNSVMIGWLAAEDAPNAGVSLTPTCAREPAPGVERVESSSPLPSLRTRCNAPSALSSQ